MNIKDLKIVIYWPCGHPTKGRKSHDFHSAIDQAFIARQEIFTTDFRVGYMSARFFQVGLEPAMQQCYDVIADYERLYRLS